MRSSVIEGNVDTSELQSMLAQARAEEDRLNSQILTLQSRNAEMLRQISEASIEDAAALREEYNSNRDRIEAMEGEVVRVTLSNTQQYPFNNSQTTVPLSKETHKTNYTVLVEVISSTGGGVGDVRITDRAVNGFKISYSGAATSVTLDCYIRGGY